MSKFLCSQLARSFFDSRFCDHALGLVEAFVAESDSDLIKGSFLCDVVQHFTAYWAEVHDANEADLSKPDTDSIPVKVVLRLPLVYMDEATEVPVIETWTIPQIKRKEKEEGKLLPQLLQTIGSVADLCCLAVSDVGK